MRASPSVVLEDGAPENKLFVASHWRLMWWRFKKHRLAVVSTAVVAVFYFVAIFAEFFAYSDPHVSDAFRALVPPQPIHLFDNGRFAPHVLGVVGSRDPATLRKIYVTDPDVKIPVRFFGHGFEYRLFGIFPTDRHLIAVEGATAEESVFLIGTDRSGRDMWSRLVLATRISLSIGLVGVALSLFLGILIGGLSGYYGGIVDTVSQRAIEVLRSVPTIPLWMGLAAAMPRDWNIIQVYFAITIIISLIGWTDLARVVRGRFLSLRQEDFVMAADLLGCSRARIIFRHMVPAFLSHIIASMTLALPAMILSETALSFLGLGLRPPAISWGVLLENAQNIQTLATASWLLIPAIPVVIIILAFNFMGDGMRDAADPYGQ